MSPEAVLLAKVAACGLDPEGISVRYQTDLQSEVITIRAESGVQAQQFDCLWNATRGSFIEFADAELASEYDAFAEQKARAWMLAKAKDWLKAHNKLDGAPMYSSGDDLAIWASRVEGFCGFKTGEALQALSSTQLIMKPIGVDALTDPRRECLFYVVTLSDLKEAGVEFGLIGNEAYPEDPR